MSWQAQEFMRATSCGPVVVAGYTFNGLGLAIAEPGSPKGRRKPVWWLIHLNSGHCVCRIKGMVADVFPVAYNIAKLGDWYFDGLKGWKNRDPDIASRLKDFAAMHPAVIVVGKASGTQDENVARKIAIARM